MFDRIIARIRRQNELKQAARELHALSDRDLNDIGIGRYDIERVVREKI